MKKCPRERGKSVWNITVNISLYRGNFLEAQMNPSDLLCSHEYLLHREWLLRVDYCVRACVCFRWQKQLRFKCGRLCVPGSLTPLKVNWESSYICFRRSSSFAYFTSLRHKWGSGARRGQAVFSLRSTGVTDPVLWRDEVWLMLTMNGKLLSSRQGPVRPCYRGVHFDLDEEGEEEEKKWKDPINHCFTFTMRLVWKEEMF